MTMCKYKMVLQVMVFKLLFAIDATNLSRIKTQISFYEDKKIIKHTTRTRRKVYHLFEHAHYSCLEFMAFYAKNKNICIKHAIVVP